MLTHVDPCWPSTKQSTKSYQLHCWDLVELHHWTKNIPFGKNILGLDMLIYLGRVNESMSISCQYHVNSVLKIGAILLHWVPWPPAGESTNDDTMVEGWTFPISETVFSVKLLLHLSWDHESRLIEHLWFEPCLNWLNCDMLRCLEDLLFGPDLLGLLDVVCALCSALMEFLS